MQITFTEIQSADSFASPELKTRANESSKSRLTRHYRVDLNGDEVAFLSLDRCMGPLYDISIMVIYEIYVLPGLRDCGIASAILSEVERIAVNDGYRIIRLRPSPLGYCMPAAELEQWYIRRGYNWNPEVPDEMEKHLSP